MKTYTVLYAEDVPHYGFHDIEAAVALHKRGGVALDEAGPPAARRSGQQESAQK
jgi:hypothetical protein